MSEPIRIGINGVERIGGLTYRLLEPYAQKGEVEVVALNDIKATPKVIGQGLARDSVFGKFDADVTYDEHHLIVNGRKSKVLNEPNPK